jgi:hypothetical protein
MMNMHIFLCLVRPYFTLKQTKLRGERETVGGKDAVFSKAKSVSEGAVYTVPLDLDLDLDLDFGKEESLVVHASANTSGATRGKEGDFLSH